MPTTTRPLLFCLTAAGAVRLIAGMMVSLTKVNDHTIIETDKVGEKIMEISAMTVSADGKIITVKSESKELERTTMFNGTKE